MMIKYLFLIFLITSFVEAIENPYKTLPSNEKLNILVNHFLNEELQNLKPVKPIKEKLKDDNANLEPIKYEQYFNYIQRIKAIQESREEEEKKLDEKYQGQLAFYNRKLNKLKKIYEDSINFNPILQRSINKAFKVVYGKPTFQSIEYNENKDEFQAKLVAKNIYKMDSFVPKNVYFKISKSDVDSFFTNFENSQITVLFEYSNNVLIYNSIIFKYNNNLYKGIFVDKIDDEIKLNIKINDGIFRLEKIEKI